MPIYEIKFASVGLDFAAEWFDNEACLWNDDRLRRPESLINEWIAPKLKLHRSEAPITSVLFNPNALAVSAKIREELSSFTELEFLPVEIADHGQFYIFHIRASCEIPEGSVISRPEPPVNGNVVKISAFPKTFEPTMAFFRVLQPRNSPAGKHGNCCFNRYATKPGVEALQRIAGKYISIHEVPHA